MIQDSESVPMGATLERDVCIVGAGPAGITLARELDQAGRSVCLLESGGFDYEVSSQELYLGKRPSGLLSHIPNYLSDSRVRMFGGSTNHWTGYCRPLDAVDFQQRSWVPNSGWPFGLDELRPFYRRAAPLLQIQSFDFPLTDLSRQPLAFDRAIGIETSLYQKSPPTNFGRVYRKSLENSRGVEVLLHANAVDLETDANASLVKTVEVASLSGRRFRVRAKRFVLAAGGLENPRLLLCANSVRPKGLGNDHDVVGRYFMEHLYGKDGVGFAFFIESPSELDLYLQEKADDVLAAQHVAVFSLSPELQQKNRLPNHQFRIFRREAPMPDDAISRAVGATTLDVGRAAGLRPRRGAGSQVALIELGADLSPARENRVSLDNTVDALGLRRLRLRYELTSLDRESIERGALVFAIALGQSLHARVNLQLQGGFRFSEHGRHHIGTTRMHRDPKLGVVDADGRVHGVQNLYIAGSSVFPTAGRANPTFTLVALALRLADHLKRELAA